MEKRHFRNAIAPFCLLLGQPLLATNFKDSSFLVPLACACLALPLLQSQPHLWLAAPQSLLLQTQNTKPFGLLSPHKSNTNPSYLQSSQTRVLPCMGGHQQQDLFALPVLLSQSLISHGHEAGFSQIPRIWVLQISHQLTPKKESEPCGYCRQQDPVPALGKVQGSEQAEAQPLPCPRPCLQLEQQQVPGLAVPVRRQQPQPSRTEVCAALKSRP